MLPERRGGTPWCSQTRDTTLPFPRAVGAPLVGWIGPAAAHVGPTHLSDFCEGVNMTQHMFGGCSFMRTCKYLCRTWVGQVMGAVRLFLAKTNGWQRLCNTAG